MPKPTQDTRTLETNINEFQIVGIGASAGGLEALEQFFQNMPEKSGLAFVIIQHLDPNRIGMMPELLQRATRMNVSQATDGLKVKPNCVYVIPPNKSLSILNGALHLFDPVESHGLRLPIDIFLRSLADDREEKSIGIILSGMGSDGSFGLKAIKEKNGAVLVQDPASAKFDGMPQSALEAVVVDIVAPAADLPAKLLAFLKVTTTAKIDSEIETILKSNIDKIIILLREKTGHDFSQYKKTTLYRRIERRKSVHAIDKIQNYVRFLQENPKEVEILFKELLIGVTSFFRDIPVWEKFKNIILPDFISKLPDDYAMRAWVVGCSTGEEAYSLAIIFKEVMEKLTKRKKISLQIFATDLDTDAIEIARCGYFNKNIISNVSSERIARFFIEDGDVYRIKTAIREMIIFAPHNVIKDPPFTKLDILSCRNMLIYMETALQHKIMSVYNYSLNPGGIMLLGTAETHGNQNDGFTDLDIKLKFYQRATITTTPNIVDFPSSFSKTKDIMPTKDVPSIPEENIQTIADQILLQRFAPASVLVNSKGDIIYITGSTGEYLEPPAGKANWNIHAMARNGLRHELPGAFRKASKHFDPVKLPNVKVQFNGDIKYVDVTVQRIEKPESVHGMIIIVFSDVPESVSQDIVNTKTSKSNPNTREKKLETELQRSIQENQGLHEEMQTSQEELRSTNEELQSTNEELQSTNEELTTSKEEMQSLNEELQTVNIELQNKVSEFELASDDMKNMLNSTEIATIFLDKNLNIRRFTSPVVDIFKVRSSDVGRPLSDLVNLLEYPEMDKHAHDVIKTLTSVEETISTTNEKWYNIRIMPYRTLDDRIDGLVITFNDVTVAKKLEFELKKANDALMKNNGNKT